MEDVYRLVGEFTLKCAAFEATADEFLFQGANHFGAQFAQRVGGRPRNIEDRADALVALMSEFMKHRVPIEKSVFTNFQSFSAFLKELSNVRNAIVHSSWCRSQNSQGRLTFALSRIGIKSSKEESGRSFERHLEEYSVNHINDTIRKLDQTQVLLECGIAALCWEIPGWSMMEFDRKWHLPVVYGHLKIHDRIMSFSKDENPFEELGLA